MSLLFFSHVEVLFFFFFFFFFFYSLFSPLMSWNKRKETTTVFFSADYCQTQHFSFSFFKYRRTNDRTTDRREKRKRRGSSSLPVVPFESLNEWSIRDKREEEEEESRVEKHKPHRQVRFLSTNSQWKFRANWIVSDRLNWIELKRIVVDMGQIRSIKWQIFSNIAWPNSVKDNERFSSSFR